MTDIAQVKQNIAKMISLNAPEEDIDGYIASEGYSLDDIRNYGKPQIKALSEEQKAKPQPTNKLDIAIEALKGFGQGVVGGTERALNTATFGGYDWLNRKAFNDAYGKRQEALQAQAENAGVGGLNTVANLLTDIGAGGATSGELALAGAGKLGLKGLGKLIGAGAIEGGAYGLTGSDTLEDAVVNVPASATTGAIISGGLGAIGEGAKRFIPSLSVIGKKSGIKGALDDRETLKALERGAKVDEDVAQTLSEKIPTVKSNINEAVADALEQGTGKRVDLAKIKENISSQYSDLFKNQGDNIILSDEIKYQRPENFDKFSEDIAEKIKNNLKRTHTRDYSVYQGFGGSGRGRGYSEANQMSVNAINAEENGLATSDRVLKELKKYPEFKHLDKKDLGILDYEEHHTGKDFKNTRFYDIESLPETFYGDSTNADMLAKASLENQRKKIIDKFFKEKGFDMSSKAKTKKLYEELTGFSSGSIDDDVLKRWSRDAIFEKNPQLKNELKSKFISWNNEFVPENVEQAEALKYAINEAGRKTNKPLGSLEHSFKMKSALGEAVSKFQKNGDYETARNYQILKSKIDDILRQNSDVKRIDEDMTKVLRQQEAYEQGYKASPRSRFNPSNEAEKTAYNKGVVDNLLSDVRADKNLASDVINKQNVLKKGLDAQKLEDLMKILNAKSGQYGKASSLGKISDRTLDRYANNLPFWREIVESQGSKVGAVLDILQRGLYGNADKMVAQRILNGMPIKEKSALLEVLARTNPTVTGEYINENFMGR